MQEAIIKNEWVVCGKCGHKLGRLVGNKIPTGLEIKCHSCKELNLIKEKVKVGDVLRIIEMEDEPQYNGKIGRVLRIDGVGNIHGTWGGLAILPDVDKFEFVEGDNNE